MRLEKFVARNAIRPDLVAAISRLVQFKRLGINQRLNVAKVNEMLRSGEQVLVCATGAFSANPGILVVTDQRVFAVRDDLTGSKIQSIDRHIAGDPRYTLQASYSGATFGGGLHIWNAYGAEVRLNRVDDGGREAYDAIMHKGDLPIRSF